MTHMENSKKSYINQHNEDFYDDFNYEDFENSNIMDYGQMKYMQLETPERLEDFMSSKTMNLLQQSKIGSFRNRTLLSPVPSAKHSSLRENNIEFRPMTSATSAGFQSRKKSVLDSDLIKKGMDFSRSLIEGTNNNPESVAREMEKKVNSLLEESAIANSEGNFEIGLSKALKAQKEDKALCKFRENNDAADDLNFDLSFSVDLSVALSYEKSNMFDDAMKEYNNIIRNKNYTYNYRVRINMGNIHFKQKNYFEAIKCYRMVHDNIPHSENILRSKVFRNIGIAFARLNQYHDAIGTYEKVMAENPDIITGFNLILCYFALENRIQQKRSFQRLVTVKLKENIATQNITTTGSQNIKNISFTGIFRDVQEKQKKDAERYILLAAKLIAPVLDEHDWIVGYDWTIETLKKNHRELSSEMEIEKAQQHLYTKEFSQAINILKSFGKKESTLQMMAATNLSFIYLLEGSYKDANRYADLAIESNRYNAKALVNKGNCLFIEQDYIGAKSHFLEAVGVEVNCMEAMFNLGLAQIQLGQIDDALNTFQKLYRILPSNTEVIYHIANLYEKGKENLTKAVKWFNVLLAIVPTDSQALARLGSIYIRLDDETQAYYFHSESFQYFPSNLDVLSWLGVWYVKSELYEKAIPFFERASQMQPNEAKWRLMVTSCYRRLGELHKALKLYERIHADFPANVECIKYLIAMCKDLGQPYDQYQRELSNICQLSEEKAITSVIKNGPMRSTRELTISGTGNSMHQSTVQDGITKDYFIEDRNTFELVDIGTLLG